MYVLIRIRIIKMFVKIYGTLYEIPWLDIFQLFMLDFHTQLVRPLSGVVRLSTLSPLLEFPTTHPPYSLIPVA